MPDFSGLLSRIGNGVRSGVNRFEDVVMPEPKGLEGLLSPEDIATARRQGMMNLGLSLLGDESPHFGAALAHGVQSAQGAYGNRIDRTAQTQLYGQDARQKMAILAARQRIAQQFPPLPNETQSQTIERMKGMFAAYLNAGDLESAGKLGEVLKSIGKEAAPPVVQHFGAGDREEIIDPRTGATIRTVPFGKSPKSSDSVAADTRFHADQTNKLMDDYRADTKSFDQVMGGWDVLQGATKDPNLATPFAVTDAYARITNPGGIVRPTTMQMIHDMGSVGQRMEKFWSQHANGALPPDILNDFKSILYNIVKEHKRHYDDVRTRTIRRGRDIGVDVTPYLTNYDVQDPLAPAPGAPPRAVGDASKVRSILGR